MQSVTESSAVRNAILNGIYKHDMYTYQYFILCYFFNLNFHFYRVH